MSEQEKQSPEQPEAEAVKAEPMEGEVLDGQAGDGADAPPADLEAELAALKDQLAATEKALSEADLRAQAEVQNMRRRLERDVTNAHKFALEKFSADLLAVADSLERGLASLSAEDEAMKPAREGAELTLKVLLDTFTKYQIEQIDPAGGQFDPQQHEAMAMVPMPNAEPNSIIEVLEKGYALNGRLIRPARVVVAKGD